MWEKGERVPGVMTRWVELEIYVGRGDDFVEVTGKVGITFVEIIFDM